MSSLKQNIEAYAAPVIKQLKPQPRTLKTADQQMRNFVAAYPLAAAAGALAFGLLLGRALSRR